MITLYLDNYRGFTDSHFHLKDVNFLVGENSTGKTSFLNVMQLLSDMEFWLSDDFNTTTVNVGGFDDIANVKSEEASFTIGLYRSEFGSTGKGSNDFAFLMTFTEREGMPSLSEYNFLSNEYNVRTSVKRSQLRYIAESLEGQQLSDLAPAKFFLQWIEQESVPLSGYSVISNPPAPLVPATIPTLVLNHLAKKSPSRRNELKFEFPTLGVRTFRDFASLAPVRAKPKRTYDSYILNFSPEGEHTPYLLNWYLHSKQERDYRDELIEYLNKFGRKSGLFENISVTPFGKEKTPPFSLDVCIDGSHYKMPNVGYGVSQVLPIVAEILTRPDKTWFAVQQPEVHLHPRAQAALGELIFDLSRAQDKKFLIETHSDFIIDRFRICVRNQSNKDKESNELTSVQVLFFERNETGNTVHHLVIDADGDYPLEQPSSFRRFFINEELELLGLQNVHNY